MPLGINLPTTTSAGSAGHSAGHNFTNAAVNQIAAVVDVLELPEQAAVARTAADATPNLLSKLTRYDTTAGAINQALPTATAGRSLAIGWDAGANALTLTAAGADVIGSGAATSFVVPLLGEVLTLHCTNAGRWRVVSGFKPQSALDDRFLLTGSRGAASGVAPLGADGKVPVANMAIGDIVMTVDPRMAGVTRTIQTANRTCYQRVIGSAFCSAIGMHVGTASGNICVAVYGNTGIGRNARPNTRKATSGSVVTPAGGWREIPLTASVQIDEGDWLAVSLDNTTASLRAVQSTAALASSMSMGIAGYEDAAFPAPATATTAPSWDAAGSFLLMGVV